MNVRVRRPVRRAVATVALAAYAVISLVGCSNGDADRLLTASLPLHLEDHLDVATVDSSMPLPVTEHAEWRFDDGARGAGGDDPPPDPAGEWKPVTLPGPGGSGASTLARLDDALRLIANRVGGMFGPLVIAGLYIRLDDWDIDDWETVMVTARVTDQFLGLTAVFSLGSDGVLSPFTVQRLASFAELPPLFNDGAEHTYALPVPHSEGGDDRAWRDLGIVVVALGPGSLDILSIEVVPAGGGYARPFGVASEARGDAVRRTLYTHTPVRLDYRVSVPEGGRLDFGMGVARFDVPVVFRVQLDDGGSASVLFEEEFADAVSWGQRSVDLSMYARRTVSLSLQAGADREGTLALWAAPTVSGSKSTERPNIIFYVIDGGGADLMSVYGYNRRTTPYMERLAEEGAVFERAHANSTWTQPSTASFMTSLQHSVLGGLNRGIHSTSVPAAATTMAEHFHAAGYQTSSLTSNPNASRMIGLDRGVDVLRDGGAEIVSASSAELHEDFWRFREDYPGEPYWAHFQTTDVHEPHTPVPPFKGLYVSPARQRQFTEWNESFLTLPEVELTSVYEMYRRLFEATEIDGEVYYDLMRGLYDETMAHQDYRLGQLVERLKASGEWANTLLVVASDHGHPAGTFARFGRGLLDPQPPDWEGALLGSYNTRIPMIFVWPGHIDPGQRFSEPVSMIDMLPTLLDLAGLPLPEVLQGQSFAPLLISDEGWEPRPVILDEFRLDPETGEMVGNIEIIDGRWGASLEIGPVPEGGDPSLGRHSIPAGGRWGAGHPFFPSVPRLLLYDLWSDPLAVDSVNDQYPELVQRYAEVLQAQWQAHRALSQQFTAGEEVPLTPEQLRTLRSLGYIR